jgi:sphinganine-1-phosphate aldolase
MAGIAGKDLPEEMAVINEVLDALPDEMANMVLIDYFNDLYV